MVCCYIACCFRWCRVYQKKIFHSRTKTKAIFFLTNLSAGFLCPNTIRLIKSGNTSPRNCLMQNQRFSQFRRQFVLSVHICQLYRLFLGLKFYFHMPVPWSATHSPLLLFYFNISSGFIRGGFSFQFQSCSRGARRWFETSPLTYWSHSNVYNLPYSINFIFNFTQTHKYKHMFIHFI